MDPKAGAATRRARVAFRTLESGGWWRAGRARSARF